MTKKKRATTTRTKTAHTKTPVSPAAATPSPAPAATAPVVVGQEYRVVGTRPGFVRFEPVMPTGPADENNWARRDVWALALKPFTLPLFRRPGEFVQVSPGDRVQLHLHHPDEVTPLRDAIALFADSEEQLVELKAFRDASGPVPAPKTVSIDDRLREEVS